ncbi:MAG: methanogenesis marker 3 protein [Candidatus Methanoliparum thermophilum]|uniref:UPF0288 protein EF806_02965 n=1 Tax=Methanoliparum thermophilum TaxID=2491083 RepID=A0A520KSY0_METT2|nr:methanogenesis marker 3 protein [Candidatus Methanoliparum sp. LAM-1]RZN65019.1 MAG: methanogenesis marker 3 protein [Candidatus Methanoliparum thermophilum]BDC36094.1 methanogenesis marker 3 protein [Candidatus Methanoliparum sp. LAM-1]
MGSEKRLRISLNGDEIELKEGVTVADLFSVADYHYDNKGVFAIIRAAEKKERSKIRFYVIKTSKGDMKIEMISKDDNNRESFDLQRFKESSVEWIDKNTVAFGPVEMNIPVDEEAYDFNSYDVFLGSATKNLYLIISRKHHKASYRSPKDPIFAKVVSGKSVLEYLTVSDYIIDLTPDLETEELSNSIISTNTRLSLKDGDKVLTHINVRLNDKSVKGSEHFLFVVDDGFLNTKELSYTYIANDDLIGEDILYEVRSPRKRGTITVRTSGSEKGKIFIYKQDRGASNDHSLIGWVEDGLRLLDLLRKGDFVKVNTNIKKISLIGKSIRDAIDFCSKNGITMDYKNCEEDYIVVKQDPHYSFEILKKKSVKIEAVPDETIANIILYYDKAPNTIRSFKKELGLDRYPIGMLTVFFHYNSMWLFKPNLASLVLPENLPSEKVFKGEIGVTNQAAKRMGMIGIKLEDDNRYGPTGEVFKATNIIGRVLEMNKLKRLKENDILYIREYHE